MEKIHYYKSFSINMNRFIKAHGIHPMSKSIHQDTGKTYWIYEMTNELSTILNQWSANKFQNKK